jgi:hypothetical protein
MTLDSRRAMPCTASGPGDVRAAGESPVPLRADPFNGAGGVVAGRDRCPRSPEPRRVGRIPRLCRITHGREAGSWVIYLPGRTIDGKRYGGRPLLRWKLGSHS